MMVKICGITNRDDALAAADAGVTAIGFNFYPRSPRYIQREEAEAIAAILPSGVRRVGVFVDATPAEAAYEFLDVIQLHGEEPAGDMAFYDKPVWKAFRVRPGWDPAILKQYEVEAVLLDGPLPGTGHAFDWRVASGLAHNIVLAGGLDATNVRDAIRVVKPWGVDACSRLESVPGRKDHEKMKRFIQAALSEYI